MYIDDYIDSLKTEEVSSYFFLMKRLPAILQAKFSDRISKLRLYCTYEGSRYRVTGASRLSDIWLTKDFRQDHEYQLRVDIEECSEFKETE